MVCTFDDFDKSAKDLLKKDFDVDTLALKIKTKGPEDLTINTNVDLFSANSIVAKVSCNKKFPQFTLDKLEHANGKTTIETTLDDLYPGLSLSLNANKKSDKISGDLSATYCLPQATLTGEVDIVSLRSLKASVCAGANGAVIGGDAELKDGSLSDFTLGAGYSLPKQAFLGFRASDKATNFSANFQYIMNSDVTIGGNASLTTKALALGGTYKMNPKTSLKWKFDSKGNMASSTKYSVDAKTSITTAISSNVSNPGNYKLGIIASLG